MSDVKLREALTYIEGLASADDARDLATIADVARQALSQPTEAVELTDDELLVATLGWREYDRPDNWPNENETRTLYGAGRAAIAAHEAKRIQS